MSFSSLGLSTELLRAVEAQGYSTPTPIQQQAIPLVLSGRDLLAGAQTGTGKTAGFTLPLLQRLSADPAAQARGTRRVRALILTPTRELAAQVAESVQTYGQHLPLRSAVIFGGVNINPQITALRRGVDIVIATPGRLLDHAQSRTIDLSHVETLVLDEADRMLDMGFIRDIRRVLALLPARRQNLLFSATFSDEIRALARDLLNDPAEVQVAPRNAAADQVSQIVHPVDAARKREMLAHMIGANDWRQVLVFTRTKHGANRLSEQLVRSGLSAAAIHGNKSQGARTRALAGFKAGEVRVLVATDIAARGLDIEQLPHVVNFELPAVPEDYVHRIGRTGRAGAAGHAVSLVSPDESSLLSAIERLLGRRIEQRVLDGYAPGRPLSTGEPGRGAGARAAASASRPAQAGARQERGRPVAGGRDKPGAGAERGKSFGGERGKPFNADRVKPSAPERHPPGVRAEAPARPAKNAAPARPALTQSPVAGPVRRAEEEGGGPRRRSRRSRGGRGGRPGAPAGAG